MSPENTLAAMVYGRLPTSDELQGGLQSALVRDTIKKLGQFQRENAELMVVLARLARKTKDGHWVGSGDWVYVSNSGVSVRLQVSKNFTVPMSVLGDDGLYRDLNVEECWRDKPDTQEKPDAPQFRQ